jgi:hypothetical protein
MAWGDVLESTAVLRINHRSLFYTLELAFTAQSIKMIVIVSVKQGCQIFLGTKYQNGKKYTKFP